MSVELFNGEVQLMGFGESDTSGCWVKLQLTHDDYQHFRGHKGKRFHVSFVWADDEPEAHQPEISPEDEVQAPPAKGPHGHAARQLMLSSFMRSPHLYKALGKPADYEEWCRSQPCIVTRDFDYTEQGEPRNQFAHVLSAAAMPDRDDMQRTRKPSWRGVPMQAEIHREQHNAGIVSIWRLMMARRGLKPPEGDERTLAQDWLERCATVHVREWAWERLRQEFDAKSMSDVRPSDVAVWANRHSHLLYRLLPEVYRVESGDNNVVLSR